MLYMLAGFSSNAVLWMCFLCWSTWSTITLPTSMSRTCVALSSQLHLSTAHILLYSNQSCTGQSVTYPGSLSSHTSYRCHHLPPHLTTQLNRSHSTQLCLEFLNAVVCYSSLPSDTLHSFVTTLCHTLNIERFSMKSLEACLLLAAHIQKL